MIDKKNKFVAEVVINAPAEKVWQVFSDWANLKEWSSSFVGLEGNDVKKNSDVTVFFMNPMNGKSLPLSKKITEHEEGKILGWSGLFMLGASDHHIYTIKSDGESKTIFRQEDGFHGGAGFLLNMLFRAVQTKSYTQFNEELKQRVEALG